MPFDDLYFLGVVNSKLIEFIIHSFSPPVRGGYYRYFSQYIEVLPIRTIDFDDPIDQKRHDEMVRLVENMLDYHKELQKTGLDSIVKRSIEQDIADTDRKIDALVYELYGLTPEEQRLVEGKS